MALKKLGKDTIQLVSSSQVITSAHSLIKELVENALDAKASNIDMRLVRKLNIKSYLLDS